MDYFQRRKEMGIDDEITPELKTKLDELAEKGNQLEEEEQYEEAIQVWMEGLKLIPNATVLQ